MPCCCDAEVMEEIRHAYAEDLVAVVDGVQRTVTSYAQAANVGEYWGQ